MKIKIQFFFFILFLFSSLIGLSLSVSTCNNIEVVQSWPIDLSPPPSAVPTWKTWVEMIRSATQSVDIGCFYMSLTEGSQFPPEQGGIYGQQVFDAIVDAGRRGVKVRIVQQLPTPNMPPNDTQNLTNMGVAEVRSINWLKLMNGSGGILHTKVIIVDNVHAYVGSANLDWRSLSQVKEVGIAATFCKGFVDDLSKIFEEYWLGGAASTLPNWPSSTFTTYNKNNPMELLIPGKEIISLYTASSPAAFSPEGRTDDLTAILDVINKARTNISFSVMDYMPSTLYLRPNYYWGDIDVALRSAAFRGVKVNLLFSIWNSTNSRMFPHWKSLNVLNNVEIRTIKIPRSPVNPQPPFSRVSHSKYLVTDQQSYVTTSNCAADYFLWTGGISVTVNSAQASISKTLQQIFTADWNGPFTSAFPN